MDFLEEQQKNDKDFRVLLETYHRRCGELNRSNKRNAFSVSDYMESLKIADQALRDVVRDYFDLDTWIAFISKPENGGVAPSVARKEWEDRPSEGCEARSDFHISPCPQNRRQTGHLEPQFLAMSLSLHKPGANRVSA